MAITQYETQKNVVWSSINKLLNRDIVWLIQFDALLN